MSKRILALTLMAVMLLFSGLAGTALAANQQYKVMVNGEYVAFDDVQPQNVNGRVMVPFRAILEKLGAEVSWDQAAKMVTAQKGDTEISFALGQSAVTVKEKDASKTFNMDAAPFVGEGRTYVGTRFMAEALGYEVGWDAANKTVVIVDFDQIFGNMDQDFSILAKSMQSDEDYMTKTFKSTADFKANVTLGALLTGADRPIKVAAEGTMTSLQKGLEADMTIDMGLDLTDLEKWMGEDVTQEDKDALKALENFSIKMKVNGANGDVFMNSDIFALMGEGYDANTWLKSNSYESYAAMGIDMSEVADLATKMASSQAALNEVVKELIAENAEDLTVDSYKDMTSVYAICKGLFGDQAFTVKEEGAKTVYTLEFTGTDVVKELMKNADLKTVLTSVKPENRAELDKILKNISLKFVITEDANKAVQTEMAIKANLPEITFDYAVAGSQTDGSLTMKLDIQELLNMDFDMQAKVQETSGKVNIALPAGAKVVDLNEMAVAPLEEAEVDVDAEMDADAEEVEVVPETEAEAEAETDAE